MQLGQTRAERDAYRLALSLFFGALLGTNLSALEALPTAAYAAIVLLLAAVVMVFQIIGHARTRRYAFMQLAMLGVLAVLFYTKRDALLPGIDAAAADRLFATLGVWFGAILVVELTPTLPATPKDQA
jgi:hypothetical protein